MVILFVCHANLNRSPRAAKVFRELADQKGIDVEIQSAGTHAYPELLNPQMLRRNFGVECVTRLTDEMLEKADIAVALDLWIQQEIESEYQIKPKRLITLGIPDNYSLGHNNLSNLYEILNKKLEPLAEEISLLQGKRLSKETL